MSPAPRPTPAELAILRVLWTQGPSTVRQVHDELALARATGYTTTLKLIQIMTDKGLLVRSTSGRQHVYRARQSEQAMQKRLVRDLLDRAFGGSSGRLVLQALATRPASEEDLREIRRLLGEQERAGKDSASYESSDEEDADDD
jgi:BlaI family penicillinase repressor